MLSAMFAYCGAFLLPPATAPSPVPGVVARRASAACMATGNDGVSFPDLDGTEVRVGILRTRWHDEIVSDLVSGVKDSLKEAKVQDSNIIEYDVPGAFELPLACRCVHFPQLNAPAVCPCMELRCRCVSARRFCSGTSRCRAPSMSLFRRLTLA